MAASVRTTPWTTSWGGSLFMSRVVMNGFHEDQEMLLRIFPPQVTAGESAYARIEPVGAYRPWSGREAFPWSLSCEESHLGTSPSYAAEIPFRIDRPGRKFLLAIGPAGSEGEILARAEFFVHREVEDEVEAIVGTKDENGARRWLRDVMARRPKDAAFREKLDLLLARSLTGSDDMARKVAFNLLVAMHEQAAKKAASKCLDGDEHAVEDVVQEAARRAWRSLGRFKQGKRFGPWFYSALLNACSDARKGRRRAVDALEASRHDDAIEAIDARETLRAVTRDLNHKEVEMLTRRFAHEEGYLEIARAMDIQPGSPDATRVTAVRRQVEKLRSNLRTAHGWNEVRDIGDTA